MKKRTKQLLHKETSNNLAAWNDSDIQSIHAEDEYEAVAEVLEQRGYGYSCSSPYQANQDTTWSSYE